MYVIKVGDQGFIGRNGGPNGYSLVDRSQDARRFKDKYYANLLAAKLMNNLQEDDIWATAIPVSCKLAR
jgi:hypothetical protein